MDIKSVGYKEISNDLDNLKTEIDNNKDYKLIFEKCVLNLSNEILKYENFFCYISKNHKHINRNILNDRISSIFKNLIIEINKGYRYDFMQNGIFNAIKELVDYFLLRNIIETENLHYLTYTNYCENLNIIYCNVFLEFYKCLGKMIKSQLIFPRIGLNYGEWKDQI